MTRPGQAYEIETDVHGINMDVDTSLVIKADELPVYPCTFERPVRVDDDSPEGFHIGHRTTEAVRCEHDDMLIWPDTTANRVGHLTRDHGYRMDGRRPEDEGCLNTDTAGS